jgi:hypothetical protein
MAQASGGHGEKRSRREDAAIAALLACSTIDRAAEAAGIAGSTLRGWLADPAFQHRYRAARRQVVEHAVSGLQRATGEAVDTLRRNLTCGVPAAEISAAKAIMDFSLKAVELVDLAERVEALEQASEPPAALGQGGRR